MKHWAIVVVILIVVGVAAFRWLHGPAAVPLPESSRSRTAIPSNPASPAISVQPLSPQASTPQSGLPNTAPEDLVTPPAEPKTTAPFDGLLSQPSQSDAPAATLDSIRRSIRDFGSRFNGNPVGNNSEITAALNGGNPKQIKFLDPAIHRLNEKGELLDSWGTPFFFHQLSASEMEIRSAGADNIMWTEDDVVTQ